MNKHINVLLTSFFIFSLSNSCLFCQGIDLEILGGSKLVNTQIIQVVLFDSPYNVAGSSSITIADSSRVTDSRIEQILIQYSNEEDKIFLKKIAEEILDKSKEINDIELKDKFDKALELRKQFENAASIARKAIDIRPIDETKSLMLIHKACKLTKNRFSLLVQLRREWVENMSPYQNIVLLENKSAINCLAISNDDKYLVAGSNDGFVYLIDMDKNTTISKIKIEEYGYSSIIISSIAFSSDNKIAIGTNGGEIIVYGRDLIKKIVTKKNHQYINFVNFRDSNTLYYSSGYDSENLLKLDLKSNEVSEIEVRLKETSPHSIKDNFLISRETNQAYLWNIKEEKLERSYVLNKYENENDNSIINSQLVTIDINDKEETIIGLHGGVFYLIDKYDKVRTRYKGHQLATEKLRFFDNGNLIVSGGYDGELIIWDREGRDLHNLKAHKNKISDILVANDDSFIISADDSGMIRKWSTNFYGSNFPETEYSFSLNNLITPSSRHKVNDIISLDEETVLTANSNGSIYKWKLYSRAPIKEFKNKHKGHVLSIDKSSDGKYFITGGADKTLKLHDIQLKELKSTNLESPVNEVLFLNNTTYLGVTDNGVVSINQIEGHTIEIIAHSKEIFTINKSQNGQSFMVGSWDGTATLWDSQGILLNNFSHNETYDHKVTSVAIHPSGNYYLTGGNYGYVKIWDKNFKYIDEILISKEYPVLDLYFSDNGKYLLSSDSGNLIKLWDFPTFSDKTIRDKEPLLSWDNTKTWERHTHGSIKSVSFFYSLDTILVAGGDRNYGVHRNLIEVLDRIYNEKYSDMK